MKSAFFTSEATQPAKRLARWLRRLLIAVAAALFISTATNAGAATSFSDDFNGSAINTSLWNTQLATSGDRFCPDAVDSTTGMWLGAATGVCQGVIQPSPYGSITVGDSVAGFSTGLGVAFPYIWSGPSTRTNPFPSSGDFVLNVRMRYDTLGGFGSGFVAAAWPNSDPVGTNSPSVPQVLTIWGGNGIGVRAMVFGDAVTLGDLDYHTYRLEYTSGSYSLFVDGALVIGPVASAIRPSTIWIGNPTDAWWGPSDWSTFGIDSVSVSLPQEVPIDVKPGSSSNPINLASEALLPVAILSTRTFDATTVDPSTVCFGDDDNPVQRKRTTPATSRMSTATGGPTCCSTTRSARRASTPATQPLASPEALSTDARSGAATESSHSVHYRASRSRPDSSRGGRAMGMHSTSSAAMTASWRTAAVLLQAGLTRHSRSTGWTTSWRFRTRHCGTSA
jgi:hypothetical protein